MRIAQILLPGASEYERKCQRVDREALAAGHEVVPCGSVAEAARSGAEVGHLYATGTLPASGLAPLPFPFLATADLRPPRFALRRPVPPSLVVTPVGEENGRVRRLPEAVEERYFSNPVPPMVRDGAEERVIGSFARPSARRLVEQTLARIERFRPEVRWILHDAPPGPEDLAGVDAWIDPAAGEGDFDGFVAEALVVGLPVVATRTTINESRLEQGRTGMLVPPGDPNEMTHAILAVLYKREVCEARLLAARQTLSKFRPRNRLRLLIPMYETVIGRSSL